MVTPEESETLIRELIAIDHQPLMSLNEGGDGKVFEVPGTKEAREHGWDIPAYPAVSMVGLLRMRNLRDCLFDILEKDVPGDFIECGVWRGGACILASRILEGTGRKVYVCDSFKGVPPPAAGYEEDRGQRIHEQNHLRVGLKEVKDNFKRFKALGKHVVFVEGLFQETLAGLKGPFCVARIDGDLYESTYVALDKVYPKLSPGGYLIEDDWILRMAQEATKDYRSAHGITAPLLEIDGVGIYWQKPSSLPQKTAAPDSEES